MTVVNRYSGLTILKQRKVKEKEDDKLDSPYRFCCDGNCIDGYVIFFIYIHLYNMYIYIFVIVIIRIYIYLYI
jgi:hypothetical protein